MGLVIVRHKVKDFATWKKAFEAHASPRGSRVFPTRGSSAQPTTQAKSSYSSTPTTSRRQNNLFRHPNSRWP
jgi:hypothetical protein